MSWCSCRSLPCSSLVPSHTASGGASLPTQGASIVTQPQRLVNAFLVPLPFFLTEFESFNLTGRGFGKVAKLHGFGTLKVRHVLTAEGDDVLGIGLHAWLGDDKGFRHLSPAFVRDGDHGDFLHGGMPVNGVLYLDRRNVLAAANNNILFAIA